MPDMRPVPGFSDLFADDQGRIWTAREQYRSKPKMLGQSLDSKGYFHVCFTRDGKTVYRTVHVLVALAFHGEKSSPDLQCRHLNGDRFDNRPQNLAWGTAKDNADDVKRYRAPAPLDALIRPKRGPSSDPAYYRARYRELRSKGLCVRCGKANDREEVYCTSCFFELQQARIAKRGKPLGTRYCSVCGEQGHNIQTCRQRLGAVQAKLLLEAL